MYSIDTFEIKTVEEDQKQGTFRISPLPTGYGHTLGTMLRRILLSSIPGAAVTKLKLKGVQHEYSTITGLQDDALSMVLALKELAVVSYSDEPVTVNLQVEGDKSGAREVKAADIEKTTLIEIKNQDHVITTLADENSSIDAEITIERGVGYSLPDESVRQEAGVIPVDAIFNPVRLVSINVGDARVGQQTDLDSLELNIQTDGTVSPSAALTQAAEIMEKLTVHLRATSQGVISGDVVTSIADTALTSSKEDNQEQTEQPILIEELEDVSTRLKNALQKAGYTDLREFEGLTEEEVASIKGLGDKSYNDLIQLLNQKGIKLI